MPIPKVAHLYTFLFHSRLTAIYQAVFCCIKTDRINIRRVFKMNLKQWNLKQIEEALGDVNRYFYWQKYNRSGSDEELIRYYAQCGGAEGFAKRHEKERERNANATDLEKSVST